MSAEAREFHEMRAGEYARAGYAALPELARTESLPERTRADFSKWEDTPTRRGVCMCCGERKSIPVMWHVCFDCYAELEGER